MLLATKQHSTCELCMLPSLDDHQRQREKQVTIIRDLEKKVADLEQQLESLSSQENEEGSGEMPAEDSDIYDHPPEVPLMSCMLHCTWSCVVLFTVSFIFSIRLLWMSRLSTKMRESPCYLQWQMTNQM